MEIYLAYSQNFFPSPCSIPISPLPDWALFLLLLLWLGLGKKWFDDFHTKSTFSSVLSRLTQTSPEALRRAIAVPSIIIIVVLLHIRVLDKRRKGGRKILVSGFLLLCFSADFLLTQLGKEETRLRYWHFSPPFSPNPDRVSEKVLFGQNYSRKFSAGSFRDKSFAASLARISPRKPKNETTTEKCSFERSLRSIPQRGWKDTSEVREKVFLRVF